MADFEQRIQNIDKSEEEFMTSLIQTFRTANPSAANEEINRAVKRKFLQGIPVNLRCNLFIFCNNPYDTIVSPQDLLKASRDAIIHLSTSTSGPFHEKPPPKVLATGPPTNPPASSAPLPILLSMQSCCCPRNSMSKPKSRKRSWKHKTK